MQNEIEVWPIDRLTLYVRNPRKNDAVVDQMCASIREYGFKIPCLARSDGEVIDGHLRLKAARKLGITEVPVILCDEWTPAQVKAFRLMVNRSVAWADWDDDLLRLELADLNELAYDLDLTGFDACEIDALLAASNEDDGADDAPALPQQAICQPGDLWVCGDHRVLCGDATVNEHVERLMGGATVDMVFTDPPYNVDYEGYTEDKLTIKGDRMSTEQFTTFLGSTFRSYKSVLKPGASMYVCHPSSWQREFQTELEGAGFGVRCQIIWAKNTFAWGFGRYKFQHEPIFYCHTQGQSDPWYGDKSQSTLWQEKKPSANRLHPTMKPVELIERALLNSSKRGDTVLDLFGGSGSTLISCERLGRCARLTELDPRYVDVIVVRWQQQTGKQATDESGRTFDDIAAERKQQ